MMTLSCCRMALPDYTQSSCSKDLSFLKGLSLAQATFSARTEVVGLGHACRHMITHMSKLRDRPKSARRRHPTGRRLPK